MHRVSVKTTRYKRKNKNYIVLLKNCGGSSGKSKIRLFDKTKSDLLFVLTEENTMYLIPTKNIESTVSITLGEKYNMYIVNQKKFSEFCNEIKEIENY